MNETIDPNLKALAWGPNSKATSWNIYFVNGHKFHTNTWTYGKKTTNSGLYVKGVTNKGQDDFYNIIHHIYELNMLASLRRFSFFIVNGLILQSMLGRDIILNIILSK